MSSGSAEPSARPLPKGGQSLTAGDRRRGRHFTAVIADAGIVAVLVWTFFPVFWLFMTSIKTQQDAFAFPPKFIFIPTLDAYRRLLSDEAGFHWPRYWFNSMFVAVTSTLLSLALGIPAAYGFTRFRFRRKALALFGILSVRFMPPIITVIPLYFLMQYLYLIDTRTALILVYAAAELPFVVWIMQGFFAAVPVELVEAAVVDGATELFALWRVVLPIATPGVVATALFSMLLSWNEFPIALVLTGENAKTIPVAATTLIAERTIYWDRVSATGVLAMVPTLLIAFLIQRHLVRGLAAGAIR